MNPHITQLQISRRARSALTALTLPMDAHGRLLHAVEKFPSAANGVGFKPLADYVHAKGLKFGIHLMRGIPRQAVTENTPTLFLFAA